jgi:hypothetical protein
MDIFFNIIVPTAYDLALVMEVGTFHIRGDRMTPKLG